MAVFAVSITKQKSWRGENQEFSNVYHYRTDVAEPFNDQGVVDALVAAESPLFGSSTQFVRARTWGPTDGSPADSVMREVIDLNQSGTGASNTSFYKEFAAMVYWPLGRYGSRNRPQYLRKWLHIDSPLGYDTSGSTPLTTTPVVIQDYIDAVTEIVLAVDIDGYELCTSTGRVPTGPGTHYPYLEHRQFGR